MVKKINSIGLGKNSNFAKGNIISCNFEKVTIILLIQQWNSRSGVEECCIQYCCRWISRKKISLNIFIPCYKKVGLRQCPFPKLFSHIFLNSKVGTVTFSHIFLNSKVGTVTFSHIFLNWKLQAQSLFPFFAQISESNLFASQNSRVAKSARSLLEKRGWTVCLWLGCFLLLQKILKWGFLDSNPPGIENISHSCPCHWKHFP